MKNKWKHTVDKLYCALELERKVVGINFLATTAPFIVGFSLLRALEFL